MDLELVLVITCWQWLKKISPSYEGRNFIVTRKPGYQPSRLKFKALLWPFFHVEDYSERGIKFFLQDKV